MLVLYWQAGRVFPLSTSDAVEKAVADIADGTRPASCLPAMSVHSSYRLDAEPVSMTTSAAVQDVNIEGHAKQERGFLMDIKVLRFYLFVSVLSSDLCKSGNSALKFTADLS